MITPSTQSHQSGLSLLQLKNRQAIEYGGFEYSFEDLHHSSTEQQQRFESFCQEAEIQDDICNRRGRNTTRRASMQNTSYHEAAAAVDVKRHRRHSTFNPRNRQAQRDAHSDFRIICCIKGINNDLVSYMHDSDEDSIEIRRLKRSSLISNPKENENFEYSDDCSDSDSDISFDVSSQPKQPEYSIDISEKDGFPCLQPRKRRQRHSYKELERRLSTESHLAILKSFIVSERDDNSKEDLEGNYGSNEQQHPVGTFQTASARMA